MCPTMLNRISAWFMNCLSDCRTFTHITSYARAVFCNHGEIYARNICYVCGGKVRQNFHPLRHRKTARFGDFYLSDLCPTQLLYEILKSFVFFLGLIIYPHHDTLCRSSFADAHAFCKSLFTVFKESVRVQP